MVLAEFGSGQVLLSIFWIFLFVIWFWLLITIFGDLFRDKSLSGVGKAAWAFFVIILPYLGIFIYLIVRGSGMSERAIVAAQDQQKQFDSYVRQTAGTSGASATDQITSAKGLLDSGAITQAEFDDLKRKALS